MTPEERSRFLRGIDLFASFDDDDLAEFATKTEVLRLGPGEELFAEGSPGTDMFVVVRGSLRVVRQRKLISTIGVGDYVGEMAIIERKPRSAGVVAAEDSLLLKVTWELFQEFFARQPPALVALMTTLSRRIRRDTEKLAAEYRRANMMIHDMKNLLSSFFLLELLERKVPEVAGHRHLVSMRAARDSLLSLLEQAMAHARGDATRVAMRPHALEALVRDVVETEFGAHPECARRTIKVTLLNPPGPFPFVAAEIRRVLVNLVLNALQASPPEGTVEVEVATEGDWGVVRVRDQGCGIPPEIRERIFSPSFTTKATGSGLGLASVKEIVEQGHGGRIEVASAPGQGSVFSVFLPLKSGGAAHDA